jgi:hypothetical protein
MCDLRATKNDQQKVDGQVRPVARDIDCSDVDTKYMQKQASSRTVIRPERCVCAARPQAIRSVDHAAQCSAVSRRPVTDAA